MSSYGGQDLFASGPHAFRFGPWQRALLRRGLAGVNGELVLDMGLRSRQIFQTGRLQADSAPALHALLEAISAFCDGQTHDLVDNCDQSHPRTLLERASASTPMRRGRGFYCQYEVEYRQLP
jgi:hypothetical protein